MIKDFHRANKIKVFIVWNIILTNYWCRGVFHKELVNPPQNLISKMKFMVFFDYENFKKSMKHSTSGKFVKLWKTPDFFIEYLKSILGWNCTPESLIRCYIYTGEFHDNLIGRIQFSIKKESDPAAKLKKEKLLEYVQSAQETQKKFFKNIYEFNFFELRTLPLQYDSKNAEIFQKGVDVQLAVDLVSNAYKNNYDVAIVCSGDVDLQKSVEEVKSLGKKVIIASHPDEAAHTLLKHADHFLNFSKLKLEHLDLFTEPYKKKCK